MIHDEHDLQQVRSRFVQLFEEDQYRMTEVARVTGRNWFRQFHQFPTEYHLIRSILELLQGSSNPLQLVKMGEPPGSRGVAYRVVDPESPELYIKVKIEEDMAWILSFKRSNHAEGGSG
jgi:hypothetical protein